MTTRTIIAMATLQIIVVVVGTMVLILINNAVCVGHVFAMFETTSTMTRQRVIPQGLNAACVYIHIYTYMYIMIYVCAYMLKYILYSTRVYT